MLVTSRLCAGGSLLIGNYRWLRDVLQGRIGELEEELRVRS